MGLFGLFKKPPTYIDSIFGSMKWHKTEFWSGRTTFFKNDVEILVPGNMTSPFGDIHSYFEELTSRYPGFKQFIANELFELYSNYREDASDQGEMDIPKLSIPDDIWEYTVLESIGISGSSLSNFKVELSYFIDFFHDYTFDAQITNWQLEGVVING